MKKIFDTEIKSNEQVAENIFRLEILTQELSEIAHAGQFVQVKISDEFTMRRPLGIASAKDGAVKIFYRIVGRGTKFLSTKKSGEHLNILGALGNGFNTEIDGRILLVGGGMGIAPLLSVAEKIPAVDILIGGKNSDEINFWIPELKNEVGKIYITTDDGSRGSKGFVTTLLPEVLDYEDYAAIYTCGPEIMMRGVAKIAAENNLPCYVSFERRMACGLGACLSCSIDTLNGRKKVCKDGPVFNAADVFY
jgi:dihydroorotate dehydrogenase electron transfer subunit